LRLNTLLALATAALIACGDDSTASTDQQISAQTCAPGLVQTCPCLGGAQGVQRCADTGALWEACMCPAAPDDMLAPSPDQSSAPDMAEDMPSDMSGVPDMPDTPDMSAPYTSPACLQPVEEQAARDAAGALYARHCAACHGVAGQGSAIGPELLGEVAEEPDRKLRKTILQGDDAMPPIAISAQEADQIIAFLLWLAREDGERLDERCE
jgi:hypothetical protein